MRIRSIKPEYFSDEKLAKLTLRSRLIFIGLWLLADDAGNTRGAPGTVRGALFPHEDVSIAEIQACLDEIEASGMIRRYEVSGERYYQIVNWRRHQVINNPSKWRNPPPPVPPDGSPKEEKREEEGDTTVGLQQDYREERDSRESLDGIAKTEKEISPYDKEKIARSNSPKRRTAPEPPSIPAEDIFIELELVDGRQYPVSRARVAEWKATFPGVDVEQQLRQMREWLKANPRKRKTAAGIDAFMVRWLIKEQDKGGGNTNTSRPQGARLPEKGNSNRPPSWYTAIVELSQLGYLYEKDGKTVIDQEKIAKASAHIQRQAELVRAYFRHQWESTEREKQKTAERERRLATIREMTQGSSSENDEPS